MVHISEGELEAYLAVHPDDSLAGGAPVLELHRVDAVQKGDAPERHQVRALLRARFTGEGSA